MERTFLLKTELLQYDINHRKPTSNNNPQENNNKQETLNTAVEQQQNEIDKKAEEKYTDAISGGNAAIFVCNDESNDSRLIIHMGNIPPKEKSYVLNLSFNLKTEQASILIKLLTIFGIDVVIYLVSCFLSKEKLVRSFFKKA